MGLVGGFGTGNSGNDATATVLASHLAGTRQDVDVVLLTYAEVPVVPAALSGYPVVPLGAPRDRTATTRWGAGRAGRLAARISAARADLRHTWTTVRGVDVTIIAGGGVFEAEAAAAAGGLVGSIGFVVLAVAASIHRHRLAAVAIGGTQGGGVQERLVVRGLRRASYLSFRDVESRDAFRTITRRRATDDDSVSADLVFAAGVENPATAVVSAHRRLVVAVMRFPWLGPGGPDELRETPYVRHLGELVARHLEAGDDVDLVSGDVADVAVLDAVRHVALGRRSATARTSTGPAPLGSLGSYALTSFEDVARAVASADLVVASRFHTIVAAVLCGVPTVAVADRAKVRSLMASASLGDLVIEARTFTPEGVARLVDRATATDTEIRRRLETYRTSTGQRARAELARVDALLRSWIPPDGVPRR